MSEQILLVVVTAVITSGLSTIATVSSLRVHIDYLRETLTTHKHAIDRAHQRIDEAGLDCRYPDRNGAAAHAGHRRGDAA